MKHHTAIYFLSSIVLMLLIGIRVPAQVQQTDPRQPDDWQLDDTFGVEVWVAANRVVNPPNDRRLYLSIPPQHFSEANLKKVFSGFATKYPVPFSLWIYVYSDKDALKNSRSYQESGSCILFIDKRVERNWYLRTEPPRQGFRWAEYYRLDERETFTYNLDPNKGITRTVNLKQPVANYNGEPTADLLLAIEYNDLEKVKAVIESGADVNRNSKYGAPPLMMAVSRGQTEIVKTLLKAGAKVNYRLNVNITEGETSLMSAAGKGDSEMIELLLDAGANIDEHNDDGKYTNADTPLIMATMKGYDAAVRTLVRRGANIDERNRYGESALMVAALAGYPKLVQFFLDNGTQVDARDKDGSTALMLAGDFNEVVEILLNAGADFKLKNNEGKTTLMLAVMEHQFIKIEALIKRGAGQESIDACKAYVAAIRKPNPREQRILKEQGFEMLTRLALKLGLNHEAIAARQQAVTELGNDALMILKLGQLYLEVGDKKSALAQLEILQTLQSQTQDAKLAYIYGYAASELAKKIDQ
ncbi:MAG: ankyrin repeat domain-containing protein [Acidobacteriota bacterium]